MSENENVVDEVVVEPTEKEIEAAEESAAFTASFEPEARADEAPAENQATVDSGDAEVVAGAEANVNPEAAAQEGRTSLTAEEVTEMLAKMPKIDELETMTTAEIRKVHGKLGELNRAMQELQKNGNNKASVKLAGANFKRLHEEYPDLADLLAQDLNDTNAEPSDNTQRTDGQNTVSFDDAVASVKQDLSKEMQTNLLLIQHRDFPQINASDEFKGWVKTLPANEQDKINDSWDAIYLGEKFTQFKEWKAKNESGSLERKERLERAVMPKGTQAVTKHQTLTEQDGFNAAFKT